MRKRAYLRIDIAQVVFSLIKKIFPSMYFWLLDQCRGVAINGADRLNIAFRNVPGSYQVARQEAAE
jgi:hypothetical protein